MRSTADDEKLMRASKDIAEALKAANALDWLCSHTDEQVLIDVDLRRSGEFDAGAADAKRFLELSVKTFKRAIIERAHELAKSEYDNGLVQLRYSE